MASNQKLMEISDWEAAIDAVERQDYDKAISIFESHSGCEWGGEPYEWKEENRERVSNFIQELVKVLPERTPFDKVGYLAENYVHQLVTLPHSIDLAATALVTFWNRFQNGDARELREFLKLLAEHPDGECVDAIARAAIDLNY